MEIRAPGLGPAVPLLASKGLLSGSTRGSSPVYTGLPSAYAQEGFYLSSSLCAALLLGAVVAFRHSKRCALVKGPSTRSRRSSTGPQYVWRRHPYWYGEEETIRVPSWMPGYKPEKKDAADEGEAFEEGKPPEKIPSFVNYEWWKKRNNWMKDRSPEYWQKVFKSDGTPRYNPKKPFSLADALDILFDMYPEPPKVDPIFQCRFQMNLDAKFPDQQIRMQINLPNGTGDEKRVAVFCAPDEEKEMLDAGAHIAGKTLSDQISAEEFDFDVLITKPANMPAIAKLGKILGARRLMPSPKSGTVVTDVEAGIKTWKAGGALELRNDPRMELTVIFGRMSQGKEKLLENLRALLQQMCDKAPPGAKTKERYIKNLFLQTVETPSIRTLYSEYPSHGYKKPREDTSSEIAKRMGLEDDF